METVGGVFEEMEMNSYKSKNLSLLISKIPSIPCSNICVEWIFSLISSHWTEPQCHVSMQVRVNLTFDRVYPVLPLHQGEGCPEGCKQLRKVLLEKMTERMKIFYCIRTERNMSSFKYGKYLFNLIHVFLLKFYFMYLIYIFVFKIATMCLLER